MVEFRELLRRLTEVGLDFVVVGGVAATLHGAQEPTRDLDVCIDVSVDSWSRVARMLTPLHPRYALTPDRRAFVPRAEELANFRNLYALTDLGRIDFLGEVPPLGSLHAVAERADRFDIDGVEIKVVSIDDLIRVKEHVRRPKDLEVAAELRALIDAKRHLPPS